MCGRIYPAGDGKAKGTHLSVFIVIMRGEYDAIMSWPFRLRVTFTMINQAGKEDIRDSFAPDLSSNSFGRPTSEMNVASGCPSFCRLVDLLDFNRGFLKDNMIYLRLTVGP